MLYQGEMVIRKRKSSSSTGNMHKRFLQVFLKNSSSYCHDLYP